MTREQAKISLSQAISLYLNNEDGPIDPLVLAEIALTHCESVIHMNPPTKKDTVVLVDRPDDIFRIWSYDQRVQQWDNE